MTRKRTFGTHEIARICQVTPPTISRWIADGKLPFYKTAGGHRRVWDVDLAAFLKEHNMPIPPDLFEVDTLTLLVVDDESGIRCLITGILKRIFPSADIHEAVDGFEAGHKIATLRPDLVLLDLRLPGVDGFNICRTVKNDPRLKDVKILTITGMGVEDSRPRVLDAGADGFLSKPFTEEDLAGAINRVMPKWVSRGGR